MEGLGSKGTPEGLGDFRGKIGPASLLVPCSTRPLSPPFIPSSISLSLFLSLWELASPGLWEVMNISSPFSSGSRPGWQLPQQVGEKENRKGWAGGWWLKSLRKGEFTSARPGFRLDLGEDGQIQSLRPRGCLRLGESPRQSLHAQTLGRPGREAVPQDPGGSSSSRHQLGSAAAPGESQLSRAEGKGRARKVEMRRGRGGDAGGPMAFHT